MNTETQNQIKAREYIILAHKDKIRRIQDTIDTLNEEIRELKNNET